MKILQIIPTLDPGGAEHFVFELSNELSQQGHHVEILTLYDVSEDNSLKVNLDKRIEVLSLNKKKGLEPRIFYSVWKLVKSRKFDVVHSHVGAIKYMLFAAIFCRKVKFVATIHSEAKREAGRSVDRWSRKLMFRFGLCVPITISKESEVSFEQYYGRKGVLIFNGVSDYIKRQEIRLRDHEGQVVFLHPASCQPVKNQQLLFNAFNRLLEEGSDIKLVWVGSNSVYLTLFNSLQPLMQKNIEYIGVVDNVRDYMVASDAICLSSKMEGMPMTIIEAFSVGCPVLCTPVGGCNNMIQDCENGCLSDDLTVMAYYKMMHLFLSFSEEKKQSMRDKAFSSFVGYSIKMCAQNYLQVYKQSHCASNN